MSLNNTLQIATSSIQANAKLAEIVGKNIANVNNPEYARQKAKIDDLGTVGSANNRKMLGVTLSMIEHSRDALLDKQVVAETMREATLRKQSQFLDGMEWALGENVDRTGNSSDIAGAGDSLSPNGLGKTIDDFFNAFHEISVSPNDQTQRQILLEKAKLLTNQFNAVDNRLREIDSSLTDEINADVTKVNNLLSNIATLSKDIGTFENVSNGAQALDLRDKRQAALEELGKYIDFTTNVPTGSNTSAMQIIVKQSPSGSDLVLVDGSNVSNTVSFDGTNVQAGTTPVNLQLAGGSLHGLTKVKSGIVSSTISGVDSLAKQFITSINAAYGANFFDANAGNFSSANIKLDSALTSSSLVVGNTGDVGANNVALAVLAVKQQSFSTSGSDNIDGTLTGHYFKLIGNVGQELANANQQLKNQTLVKEMITARRDTISGVSMDEEVADLMKYQKAFQASARIMSKVDEMWDTLVNGIIR